MKWAGSRESMNDCGCSPDGCQWEDLDLLLILALGSNCLHWLQQSSRDDDDELRYWISADAFYHLCSLHIIYVHTERKPQPLPCVQYAVLRCPLPVMPVNIIQTAITDDAIFVFYEWQESTDECWSAPMNGIFFSQHTVSVSCLWLNYFPFHECARQWELLTFHRKELTSPIWAPTEFTGMWKKAHLHVGERQVTTLWKKY